MLQDALVRWAPKAPLDFAALIEEPVPASAYLRLRFPTLIIRGEHSPPPTRLIADTLPSLLPFARSAVVAGAGHMGPLTHAAEVNALIVRHVVSAKRPAMRSINIKHMMGKAILHARAPHSDGEKAVLGEQSSPFQGQIKRLSKPSSHRIGMLRPHRS